MARALSEETQRRKAEVMRMRRQGMEFAEIGAVLGVSKQRAHQIYTATLKEIPAEEVALYRAEISERLDELLRKAHEVLGRRHLTVSAGTVVRIGEPVIDEETGEAVIREEAGEPVYDDGPTLAAIKTILMIEQERAKLYGAYAPVEQRVGGDVTVTYRFEGIDLENLK